MTREDQDRVGDITRAINRLFRVKERGRSAFDGDWTIRSTASSRTCSTEKTGTTSLKSKGP